MRFPTFITLASLALASPCFVGCGDSPGSATAAPPTAATADANAADAYIAVISSLGQSLLDALQQGRDVDSELARHSGELDRAAAASERGICDFGVDYSRGLLTKLPHLAKIRALARVLLADADRLLRSGDADAAARRTAATLRMSAQLARSGRYTIELLVSASIAEQASLFVLDHPGLSSAAWKTDVLHAINDVRADGTLGSERIVAAELEAGAEALRADVAPDYSEIGGRDWRSVSAATRESTAVSLDSFAAEVRRAWRFHDATARLQALGQRARSAEFGQFTPDVAKLREVMTKLDRDLDRAAAALR